MLKYYIALFLIAGAVLYYIFTTDPCNNQLRTDFSNKYPDYEILFSSAGEGIIDIVHCHIDYEKPGSKQIYEDVWVYQKAENGWKFSKILSSQKKQHTQ